MSNFQIKDFYQILKPAKNPKMITNYEVVIGGTRYAQNFVKGVIIASLINSEVCTSQTKKHEKALNDLNKLPIKMVSKIQYNFQIDIYKQNDDNATEIQAFSEALKIREWLKSYQVQDYLKIKNAEILASYGIIQMTTEIIENKLINRAFFEVSILSDIEIQEQDEWFDKVKIEGISIISN